MFDEFGRITRTWVIFFERLWMQPQSGDVPGSGGAGTVPNDQKATFGLLRELTVEDRLTLYYIVRRAGTFLDVAAKIAEQAPTGADAILDIQRSTDDGTTWESIFPSGDLLVLPAAATATVLKSTFSDTVTGVSIGDLLRIGCTQTGSVDPGKGIEVVLQWEADLTVSPADGSIATASMSGTATAS